MKKQTLLLISIACIMLTPGKSYSQCMPDTVTCRDILEPGQICPDILPDGYLGVSYNQTVTILPPSSATMYDIPFTIVKIKIDTIENLPPGIVYEANATELYPDTAYCVLLSGIPTETGEFEVSITVIPYIDLIGNVIKADAVVNDTSVKISVHGPNDIQNIPDEEFYIIGNHPNPFYETTELGFIIDKSSLVKLNIYNNIGMIIYSETIEAEPGENFFMFNGDHMVPGCYIYTIVYEQVIYSDKLIKSR
ncbi:MAG: T9SS type A sorting domain-containing protein [Bacteroidales bacterium]|nr:T9SS type A sorting domain-containing protein [Bacteroidales bacterium]